MKLRRTRAAAEGTIGPLDEILAVERANAELLATETAKANACLRNEIAAVAQAAESRIAEANAAAVRALADRRELAAHDAAALVRDAEADAARLLAISDERLVHLLRPHLAAILPRGHP